MWCFHDEYFQVILRHNYIVSLFDFSPHELFILHLTPPPPIIHLYSHYSFIIHIFIHNTFFTHCFFTIFTWYFPHTIYYLSTCDLYVQFINIHVIFFFHNPFLFTRVFGLINLSLHVIFPQRIYLCSHFYNSYLFTSFLKHD